MTRLLTITGVQEKLTARVERRKRWRQHAQENIKHELEVSKLRALVVALPPVRVRLTELVDEFAPKVQVLHPYSQRSSQVLKASIAHPQRSRSHRLRLTKTESTGASAAPSSSVGSTTSGREDRHGYR
jgi:hypothetical protein